MPKTAPKKETHKEAKVKTPKSGASATKEAQAALAPKAKVKKRVSAGPKKAESSTPATIRRACQINGCKREYRAKGYCGVHYKKWRQGEYGKARYTACSDLGCFRPQALNRFGYCEEHFQNYYVKGMAAPKPAPENKESEGQTKAAAS